MSGDMDRRQRPDVDTPGPELDIQCQSSVRNIT